MSASNDKHGYMISFFPDKKEELAKDLLHAISHARHEFKGVKRCLRKELSKAEEGLVAGQAGVKEAENALLQNQRLLTEELAAIKTQFAADTNNQAVKDDGLFKRFNDLRAELKRIDKHLEPLNTESARKIEQTIAKATSFLAALKSISLPEKWEGHPPSDEETSDESEDESTNGSETSNKGYDDAQVLIHDLSPRAPNGSASLPQTQSHNRISQIERPLKRSGAHDDSNMVLNNASDREGMLNQRSKRRRLSVSGLGDRRDDEGRDSTTLAGEDDGVTIKNEIIGDDDVNGELGDVKYELK